jgi:hypothetical protein
MLFDLQGRRRRVVQVVYLTLAVLMGGGLVFFGIGGDVSGGLFDAFSERDGGGGNDQVEERVERFEELAARPGPRREEALQELVRGYYQLAVAQTDPNSPGFPEDAQDELQKAAASWKSYLEVEREKPDPSLATVALQVFDPLALNRPKEAQEAARIVAEAENDSPSYIRLVQYAALAGDTRTANLAGVKAIDLAPKGERKAVKEQVELAKQTQAPAQGGGTASGG